MTSLYDKTSRNIIIVGKYKNSEMAGMIAAIANFIIGSGFVPFLDKDTKEVTGLSYQEAKLDGSTKYQMGIAVGGDGTMMGAARTIGIMGIPLAGVNKGRVGFLTDIADVDLYEKIRALLSGNFTEEKRSVLGAKYYDAENQLVGSVIAINDLAIKSSTGKFLNFTTFSNNEFVSNQYADGIIISSPTGSTAYALSSGGAIIHPKLAAWQIVPICPQSLSSRAIVVPDDEELRIFHSGDDSVVCIADGFQSENPLMQVVVRKSDTPFTILHPTGYSYYEGLRFKLNWS